MRPQLKLDAFLFAAAATILSMSVAAANEPEKTKPAEVQPDQPPSHMMMTPSSMKDGMPMMHDALAPNTSKEKVAKPRAAQNRSKHFHPRDGK